MNRHAIGALVLDRTLEGGDDRIADSCGSPCPTAARLRAADANGPSECLQTAQRLNLDFNRNSRILRRTPRALNIRSQILRPAYKAVVERLLRSVDLTRTVGFSEHDHPAIVNARHAARIRQAKAAQSEPILIRHRPKTENEIRHFHRLLKIPLNGSGLESS